jgi:CHAD domain-containing protein/adenylate cyclase class IV
VTNGHTPHPVEIELKYRLDDLAAGDGLLARDELGGLRATGATTEVHHDDRYLDTPDGALARAGYAARLRHSDGGTVVTVKGLPHHDGGVVHRREELEGAADPSQPPAAWPESAARDRIVEIARDVTLVELVVLRQRRKKRLYELDGTVVELSVDAVEVVSDGGVIDSFAEVEVELREGDEWLLGQVAETLAGLDGLSPMTTSKLERAMETVRRGLGTDHAALDGDGDGEHAAGDGDGGWTDEPAAATESEAADPLAADDALVEPAAPKARRRRRPRRSGRPPTEGDASSRAEETADTSGGPTADVSADADAATASDSASDRASDGDGAAAAASADGDEATDLQPTPDGDGNEPNDVATTTASASEPAAEPRLTAGKTAGVLTDDHLAEAGRKVLRFHLARMVAREPGTREGTDNEQLHGMRVATRRQRAAWRVFGDAFDQKRTARHQRRLRDVARDLGTVRDLDVLLEAAEAYQHGLPDTEQRAFEPLLDSWRAQREAARVVLLQELDSDRYQRWVDDYILFVQTEGLGVRSVGPIEAHRVRDTMPSRIWTAYEGVRAYEPVMRWADVATLHDLRIAAKWLRYTIEFVREALGPETAPVIERVVALQDHLGWMHDADVAAGLARTFLVQQSGALTEAQTNAIGRYLVDRERELARLRRTVGPAWRGVASLNFRRALGRLVAGL